MFNAEKAKSDFNQAVETYDNATEKPECPELEKMKLLASMVTGNKHFKRILQDANPALRKQVYDHIKPHLKFTPKPYFLLMK